MPIKKRNATADLTSPTTAPAAAIPQHVADPAAILNDAHGPRERRTRAFYGYAFDSISPTDIPVDDLARLVRTPLNDDHVDHVYRSRIKGRLTGIRAKCVECQGGSPKKARTCVNVECPLWAFRTGANGMRGARKP